MTPPTEQARSVQDAFGVQGFGAMRLADGDTGDRDPVAVVHAALDAGVRMVDTAELYGNEELVGRAIRPRRDDVLLATKFGVRIDPGLPQGYEVRAGPGHVRASCTASLRRLGVEVIDLYYLHHRSDEVPIEDTVGAMASLVEDGRVRAIGLSNVTAEDLRRACTVYPVAALQEQWSLTERTLERELVPTAAHHGVTVVAHSPTGHGVLHGSGAGTALAAVAQRHGLTPGQVALAWVHHRDAVHGVRVVPLPGTTSVVHARQNVAAADVRLTPDDLRELGDTDAD